MGRGYNEENHAQRCRELIHADSFCWNDDHLGPWNGWPNRFGCRADGDESVVLRPSWKGWNTWVLHILRDARVGYTTATTRSRVRVQHHHAGHAGGCLSGFAANYADRSFRDLRRTDFGIHPCELAWFSNPCRFARRAAAQTHLWRVEG